MLVLEIVLAAVVVFGVAAVAMGHGGSITHFAPDWPGRQLPEDRTLRPDDVVHARFSLAVRGYRMSEVDAVLDRLALEIAQRDARIEQLTGRPYETPLPGTTAEPAEATEDTSATEDTEAAQDAAELTEHPAEPAVRSELVQSTEAFSDDAFRRPDPDAGP